VPCAGSTTVFAVAPWTCGRGVAELDGLAEIPLTAKLDVVKAKSATRYRRLPLICNLPIIDYLPLFIEFHEVHLF
jgi:hypothetical protein